MALILLPENSHDNGTTSMNESMCLLLTKMVMFQLVIFFFFRVGGLYFREFKLARGASYSEQKLGNPLKFNLEPQGQPFINGNGYQLDDFHQIFT